ncbi:MAG: adenosylmethionine decarboxylase [Thermodesulfobacteriota bacterium]
MTIEFEGPEKKLEIILAQPDPGMRSNADGRWGSVVHACGAEIVSARSTPEMDAYLLSESSLFVWADRILMITCGKTTLVQAVPKIIEIVGLENIAFFFYERKNLMYPQQQPSDFESDVKGLSAYFDGKSYRLGPANHDHVHIFYASMAEHAVEEDHTIEILMHDLHPEVIAAFIPRQEDTVDELEARTGIAGLYPDMENDSFQFQPYGYSMNKIAGSQYVTIHVTPEESGSYASFETNVDGGDFATIASRITEIFRPSRFSLVITESTQDRDAVEGSQMPRQFNGYHRSEKSIYEFDSGYAVSFYNYFTRT